MLKDRVISALIGAPLILLVLWAGGGYLAVLLALLAVLAGNEVINLLIKQGFAPYKIIVYLGLLLFIFLPAGQGEKGVIIALMIVVAAVGVAMFLPDARRTPNGASTIFAVLYIGFLLSQLLLLRSEPWGFSFALVTVLATWTADMASYFVGKAWGTVRLAPILSPKKTWEGMIAGLIAAGFTSTLLFPVLPGKFLLEPWYPPFWGLVIGISALVGDLFESALKRRAGVKDAGSVIPGHGGILDRFDGLLFSGAAGFLMYRLLIG